MVDFPGGDLGAVVADIGSFASKIGYAGDDTPKAYFPSLVGLTGGLNGQKPDIHFDLFNFRQHMAISNITKDGVINNWDEFEKLWEHANRAFLKVDYSECPVLMSEKPYTPSSCRQRLTEVMFERFNAPSFFLSKDCVLSCYACGKTSGLVVDVGGQGSVTSCVLDGWVDSRSVSRSIVGGRVLDAYLLSLLKHRSLDPLPLFRLIKTVTQDKRILVSRNPNIVHVHPSYDALMKLEIGRDIKESVVRVSVDGPCLPSDSRYANIPLVPYELPDGNVVDLGGERFYTSELLFDPSPLELGSSEMQLLSQFGLDYFSYLPSDGTKSLQSNLYPTPQFLGLSSLAIESVVRCDHDVQSSLLGNVVVAGGTSSLEGLPDRLKQEMENQLIAGGLGSVGNYGLNSTSLASSSSFPASASLSSVGGTSGATLASRVRVTSASSNARALSCWIGGSIVASLSSMHDMWISNAEYQEYGAAIVDRKCP